MDRIMLGIPTKKVAADAKLGGFFSRQRTKLKTVGTAFVFRINFLRTRHKMSTAAKTTQRKTATKKDAKETAVAAPVAAVAAPAPAPVVVAAAVTPVVAAAAPAVVEKKEEEVNIVAEFNSLVEKVNKMRSAFTEVFSEMKKLEKRIPRELKKASKGRRNRKAPELNADGTEKPKKESVFTKPSVISEELCVFLGKAKGSLASRSEVTTAVCDYAKKNGLMEKQNIKADASLRKLLKITEKDELKILNLQRFLKPHYIKATPVA